MSDYSSFFNRSMNRWMCKCGSNNTGDFCDNCGISRSEGERRSEEDGETQSVFAKPREQESVDTTVSGSMFSTGSSEQPFRNNDAEEEDMSNISPFKPASFSSDSSSLYSESYDETPRASRQSYVISSAGESRYTFDSDYVDPHRRKISNRLSLISVILKYGVGGVLTSFFAIINILSASTVTTENAGDFLASLFVIALLGAASTVGIILMIVARVKDSRAPFAKVLMILYIAEVVLGFVLGILIVVVGSSTYISMMGG